VTEPIAVDGCLDAALRKLVDDVVADRPTAFRRFQTWCIAYAADIEFNALVGRWVR
jgi:hypothetical protein